MMYIATGPFITYPVVQRPLSPHALIIPPHPHTTQSSYPLTHATPYQAPPSVLGPAYLRLLALEETRLELLPTRRGELLPLYDSLLAAAEAAVVQQGKGGGGTGKEEGEAAAMAVVQGKGGGGTGEEEGEGEDDGAWLARAVAPHGLPQLVEIRLACGPFPLDWRAVVAAAKRVLAVAASAASAAGCVYEVYYDMHVRCPLPTHPPLCLSPSPQPIKQPPCPSPLPPASVPTPPPHPMAPPSPPHRHHPPKQRPRPPRGGGRGADSGVVVPAGFRKRRRRGGGGGGKRGTGGAAAGEGAVAVRVRA